MTDNDYQELYRQTYPYNIKRIKKMFVTTSI